MKIVNIKKNLPQSISTSLASSNKGNIVQNRLVDYKDFLELIQYERSRSDRLGDVFSLVVISGSNNVLNLREIGMIKNIINPQLRSTDYMGWYGNNSLALLLPLADNSEAKNLMSRMVSQIKKMGIAVKASCHSYPENWFNRTEDQGNLKYTPWCPEYKENEVGRRVACKMPLWKRAMDIVLSSVILTILSPLFLLVSIFIKMVSPGPAFFVQERVGHKGQIFKFYKFRTMHVDNNEATHGKHASSFINDGDIPMVKLDTHDTRIIRCGGLLRSSSIDELPQLFNVLKGDMSLVGPRPCIPYEAEDYLRWHTHRFDIVPGITGLWQVSGKNDLTFKEMVRLDIAYSKNISFLNDIKIMLRTIPTVLHLVGDFLKLRAHTEIHNFEATVDPQPQK